MLRSVSGGMHAEPCGKVAFYQGNQLPGRPSPDVLSHHPRRARHYRQHREPLAERASPRPRRTRRAPCRHALGPSGDAAALDDRGRRRSGPSPRRRQSGRRALIGTSLEVLEDGRLPCSASGIRPRKNQGDGEPYAWRHPAVHRPGRSPQPRSSSTSRTVTSMPVLLHAGTRTDSQTGPSVGLPRRTGLDPRHHHQPHPHLAVPLPGDVAGLCRPWSTRTIVGAETNIRTPVRNPRSTPTPASTISSSTPCGPPKELAPCPSTTRPHTTPHSTLTPVRYSSPTKSLKTRRENSIDPEILLR